MQNFKEWLSNRDPEMLNEIKKPFKNFNKEKNHPEGGLKPSYAKKLGIHAGIETKREAERKGGVDKMSKKTKARRKSFCARMGGMEGPMKDENGEPTRKALALRKWNC